MQSFIKNATHVSFTDDEIIGPTGYIDSVKPEHFCNGARAIRGVDTRGRCYLSFKLRVFDAVEQKRCTLLYTVFQRYEHDDSTVVFCLSHFSETNWRFIEEHITGGSITMPSSYNAVNELPRILRRLETEAEVILDNRFSLSLG